MGGMGFIQSNHSRILYNSTMISFNVSPPPPPTPMSSARMHPTPSPPSLGHRAGRSLGAHAMAFHKCATRQVVIVFRISISPL